MGRRTERGKEVKRGWVRGWEGSRGMGTELGMWVGLYMGCWMGKGRVNGWGLDGYMGGWWVVEWKCAWAGSG